MSLKCIVPAVGASVSTPVESVILTASFILITPFSPLIASSNVIPYVSSAFKFTVPVFDIAVVFPLNETLFPTAAIFILELFDIAVAFELKELSVIVASPAFVTAFPVLFSNTDSSIFKVPF